MRDIKFRAKGKNQHINKWAYGYLADEYYISEKGELGYTPIRKETIGQYTGLKDKSGKEIYEGDIIFDSFYERKAKVVFLEGAFWLDYIDDFKEYETIHKRYQLIANYDNKSVLEVIGNIYDNPELLEEGE